MGVFLEESRRIVFPVSSNSNLTYHELEGQYINEIPYFHDSREASI